MHMHNKTMQKDFIIRASENENLCLSTQKSAFTFCQFSIQNFYKSYIAIRQKLKIEFAFTDIKIGKFNRSKN